MKILITENKIEKVLKQLGTEKTIQLLGGWDNFCKIFNIKSPMDFLHLFDDLEQVQSDENKNFTLFRYNEGDNLMIHDRKQGTVFISYYDIWSYLRNRKTFELDLPESIRLTKEWVSKVYKLDDIGTSSLSLDEWIVML